MGEGSEHGNSDGTIVIHAIYSTKVQPVTVLGRGLFIPPTKLHHSLNAPPLFSEVQRLHQGWRVISMVGVFDLYTPIPRSRFSRRLPPDLRARSPGLTFGHRTWRPSRNCLERSWSTVNDWQSHCARSFMVLSGGSSSCLSANLREGPLLRICIRGASPNLPCAKQQGTKSFVGSVTVSRKPSGEADLRGWGVGIPNSSPSWARTDSDGPNPQIKRKDCTWLRERLP